MDNKDEQKIKDAISLSQGQKDYINNKLSDKPLHINTYKKTERIVSAVFMITAYFDKEEILKMSLRKTATSLLKNTMSFINGRHDSYKTELSKRIISDVSELYSYFEFAYLSQIISENNYTIFVHELDQHIESLKDILEERETIRGQELTNNFFDTNSNTNNSAGNLNNSQTLNSVNKNQVISKGHNKGQQNTNNVLYKNKEQQKDTKDILKDKQNLKFKGSQEELMKFLKEESNRTSADNKSFNKNEKNSKNSDREEKIIQIIKDKKQVSIKDITDAFSGVSSKTIQRELSKLVEKNILIKEGERRWSTYRLV